MTGLYTASRINKPAGRIRMGQLLSLALLALLAATPDARADIDVDRRRMEELERRIEETDTELGRIRKDLKDFEAVVMLWDVLKKNYLNFTQVTESAVEQCYDSFRANQELEQKTGLKSPYSTQHSHCQNIISGHEKITQSFEDQIDRIRRDVEIIRSLSENAASSAQTNQRNRESFEAEKRLIETMKSIGSLPGMTPGRQKNAPSGIPSN